MRTALLLATAIVAYAQNAPGRPTPPSSVTCARDRVTAFDGRAVQWSRTVGQSTMTIASDEGTTEIVVLKHPGTDDGSQFFLLNSKLFKPADWSRIEEKPGTLRAGLRVQVWACDDGRQPVIDWKVSDGKSRH
jgi:hypothetical protein